MIDTICLKHISTKLSETKLRSLGATARPNRTHPTWVLNPASGVSMPRITVSQTPDSIFHVYAESSIPKLLYGHNSRLPDSEADVRRGIEMMCEYTRSRLGVSFDTDTAVINKIHLTRDYALGDAANGAIFALFDRRLRYFPKRNIMSADGQATTLYFNYSSARRNCVICIYPKQAEVRARNGSHEAIAAAQGILRIEYRANTRTGVNSVCNRFNLNEPRDLLTSDLNDQIFHSLERELNFPECINDRESPLTRLLSKYSERRARGLFGFLEMRRLKGDAELTKTISDRRNFNAARRDCERAGVWLDLRQTQE